ncbi:MAG TPA: GNAT family N-acetyltransferase [Anaerolineales bacterium]|nr:GNAT family N-acetyltransferase [Anaerolineales bacterium]
MQNILCDFSEEKTVKESIKENWKHYHYCLGRSPSVELSIGRYLTWFITKMPDHFMNLVVCTELPSEGIDELIENALSHFRSLHIRKLSWLVEEGIPALKIKKHLIAHGLTVEESFAIEMAVDLSALPESTALPAGLEIIPVEDRKTLSKWIHVASIAFGVPEEFESTWYEFFVEGVLDLPFRSYLALLNGQPVGTSQLFLSAGVAGIYNVTCIPEARGQGIGAALTLAPLLYARDVEYRIGILQASELGHRVYRRLGFQDFGQLSVYLWVNEAELLSK